MSANILHETFSPRQTAAVFTVGYMAILFIGILATIALCFAALWMLIQFCFLALASVIETLQTIGSLYAASDPMIRFLVLVALAYGIYRAGRYLLRKRGNQ